MAVIVDSSSFSWKCAVFLNVFLEATVRRVRKNDDFGEMTVLVLYKIKNAET